MTFYNSMNSWRERLRRYFKPRFQMKVASGVTYSSEGGSPVEIFAESGSTVHAYANAIVWAADGSTVHAFPGSIVHPSYHSLIFS